MHLSELDLDNNPFELPDAVVAVVRDAGVLQSLWPVLGAGRRVVLYVTGYGIRIYDGSRNALVEWSDMFELTAAADGFSYFTGRTKEQQRFSYLDPGHAAQIQDAIHDAGGNVPRVQHIVTDQGRTALAPEPTSQRSRGPRVTDAPDAGARARTVLLGLFWGGLIVGIVGISIALAAFPATKISEDTGLTVDTGSSTLAIIGSAISSAGSGMVLVALIGWAVMLGVRAARD